MYGRAVGGYNVPKASNESGVPTQNFDGTCHFGNAQDSLPSWYSEGYLTAPDDETYNGFPWTNSPSTITSDGVGKSCGECFEIFGDLGSIVVMVVDICDKMCCKNCQGSLGGPKGPADIPNFDINSATIYKSLTSANNGGIPISYRKISCNMSSISGVGVMFHMENEGKVQEAYFRMRVFGAAVGIASVEVKGAITGGTGGNWTPLKRFWEGGWNWTNSGNIGAPFQVRVTSILGDVLTLPTTINSTDFQANKKFYFNAQFPLPPVGYGGSSASCVWPGPPSSIYTDALVGDGFNNWVDWGSYTTQKPVYNSATNCFSGNCISVGPTSPGAVQIGYSSGVGAPSTYYKTLSFYCTSSATTKINIFWTFSGAISEKITVNVTTTWTKTIINISSFFPTVPGKLHVLQIQFTSTTTQPVLFDDIQLNEPQVEIPLRISSPQFSGPPAVGFPNYNGPAICCEGNTTIPTPISTSIASISVASTFVVIFIAAFFVLKKNYVE